MLLRAGQMTLRGRSTEGAWSLASHLRRRRSSKYKRSRDHPLSRCSTVSFPARTCFLSPTEEANIVSVTYFCDSSHFCEDGAAKPIMILQMYRDIFIYT